MQDQEHTCGKGLAERAVLPASVARLIASLADILETHMTALDPEDADARKEHAAYLRLETACRDVAAELHATAREMAGYADLPMGRHDPKAMSGPGPRDAFAAFVKVEEDLLTLLRATLDRDRKMLAGIQAAIPERG
jgi:hypothetical protein